MEKNYMLNVLKAFACAGVVFIHVRFPGVFGQIVAYASRYAVPVFFMTAGYYAFAQDLNTIKRRLIKILVIFIYSYTLYLLYNLIFAIYEQEGMNWVNNNFNRYTIIKYICFCTIDFAIPLWYLIAMIEVYLTWLLVVKNGKQQYALNMLPLLFILYILLTFYCETNNLEWFWKTNFVTGGMSWYLLGYYLHTDKAEKIKNLHDYKLIIVTVLGLIIAIAPVAFNLTYKFNVVGYIPMSFGLFIIALKNHKKGINTVLEFIGEKLSFFIYIVHPLINDLVGRVLSVYEIKSVTVDFFRPLIILLISILISLFLFAIISVRRCRC